MLEIRLLWKTTSATKLRIPAPKFIRTAVMWITIAPALKSVPFSYFFICNSATSKNPAVKYRPIALA
jgi:hypothetical protein